VIFVASFGGACTALLAFLSNSFQDYKDTKAVESGKAVSVVVPATNGKQNPPLKTEAEPTKTP
jgi:hypothetical protein